MLSGSLEYFCNMYMYKQSRVTVWWVGGTAFREIFLIHIGHQIYHFKFTQKQFSANLEKAVKFPVKNKGKNKMMMKFSVFRGKRWKRKKKIVSKSKWILT